MAWLLVLAAAAVAHSETASFSAVYWDLGNQRWRDTATTPYQDGPIGSYDYTSATVQFEYPESGSSLTGVLAGSGLKPNFTYQMKLNGKPSYFWAAAGDDAANERLGFAGRWWLTQVEKSTGSVVGGWNSNDTEYLSWQSVGFEDENYDYVFEGYLLFDYVVTDAAGGVSKALAVESSFHVLWKASQRPPGSNDSDPVAHVFVVDGSSDWYANSQPDETRSLYAEWEPTRALPGELSLPVGSYLVRIFLTEESFHENATSPPSGRWATVMSHDDLHFTITAPPACSDGLDNDGDGFTDFVGGDPGCAGPEDLSENDPTLPCDDGVDNDGDGTTDYPADPGCSPTFFWAAENPECQDGVDNDGNGSVDFDGGLSALGYIAAAADPKCFTPQASEVPLQFLGISCGLGVELALLLPPLMWLYQRRRRRD